MACRAEALRPPPAKPASAREPAPIATIGCALTEGWSRWRDLHSRGAMRPAVYETAAVAAEPHRRNGGSPRCCPVLCGLRDRCIAAMLATRTRHEGGVEPPQPGL